MKKSSNSPPKSCRRERWRRVLALTLVANLLLTALGASFKVQPVQALAMGAHGGGGGWAITLTSTPNFLSSPAVGQVLGNVAISVSIPESARGPLPGNRQHLFRAIVRTPAGTVASTDWHTVSNGSAATLTTTLSGWSPTTTIGVMHTGQVISLSIEHQLKESSYTDSTRPLPLCAYWVEGVPWLGEKSWNHVPIPEGAPHSCDTPVPQTVPGGTSSIVSVGAVGGVVQGGGVVLPTWMQNSPTPITFPNTPTQLPPHLLNSPTPITFPNTPTQLPPHLLNSPTPITFVPTNTPLPGHLLTPKVAHNANG